MSNPIRIGLVAEGITDRVVLDAAIAHLLDDLSYDLKLLQPEGSVAFSGAGDAGAFGGGWKGVYKWCDQSSLVPFPFTEDPLFRAHDILIIHLDADVGEDPTENDWPPYLPCIKECPPPNLKTNALRDIILKWLGETTMPPRTVFCTPSKSTEAWMIYLFNPTDREMKKKGWECHTNPAGRLGQIPKAHRFRKSEEEYRLRSTEIKERWPELASAMSEAKRFEDEFLAALP